MPDPTQHRPIFGQAEIEPVGHLAGPWGNVSVKMALTSCAVKNAPTPDTHSLRWSLAKTCGGSVRRCCSRQVSLTQLAHGGRLAKYQSTSRRACSRTSQATEV